MAHIRKGMLVTGAVLLACGCGLWLGSGRLLASATRRGLRALEAGSGRRSVRAANLQFADARIALPRRVVWRDVSGDVTWPGGTAVLGYERIWVHVGRVTVTVNDFRNRVFTVEANELLLEPRREDAAAANGLGGPGMRIRGESLAVRQVVHLFDRARAAGELRGMAVGLRELFASGRSSVPVSFGGTAAFSVRDRDFEVGLRVVDESGVSVLRIDEGDLRDVAGRMGFTKPLQEAELQVLLDYPLRAARLLQLRDVAAGAAAAAYADDATVPEDAYRHVLWSFLLTRQFGPEFAERVTDAHEAGLTGNTPEERAMDLTNNALGRDYAGSGLADDQLLMRVLNDPAVVRSAAGPGATPATD